MRRTAKLDLTVLTEYKVIGDTATILLSPNPQWHYKGTSDAHVGRERRSLEFILHFRSLFIN